MQRTLPHDQQETLVLRSLVVVALVLLSGTIPLAASAEPAGGKCNSITTRLVKLDGKNDEWVSADLKLKPGDLVVVFVGGQVVIGRHLGAVDASGSRGDGYGKVEMKVGPGTVLATGTRYTATFQEGGSVKFRVWDTEYKDNSGAFEVVLIVIPGAAIPEPTLVAAE